MSKASLYPHYINLIATLKLFIRVLKVLLVIIDEKEQDFLFLLISFVKPKTAVTKS